MTIVIRARAPLASANDDVIAALTLRYKAAYAVYRYLVDENADLCMTGGRLSKRARYEEELAFEELDSARHALLRAAARAYPTIH
jgi:hypothetical protein